eukprot:CAMPEP_0174835082 /NCGR_PEP_ID=MMETSP1114-20130205/5226_1 /TAXON_ID=312471 /ORGANISM="Neobodo designis, Strain CCAP 1951/1" /LENGTH=77 /DNA_ID=CAMNT_0016069027 /DNA_START=194 /DNA_END=428 /DNA_ORIENTATION=-
MYYDEWPLLMAELSSWLASASDPAARACVASKIRVSTFPPHGLRFVVDAVARAAADKLASASACAHRGAIPNPVDRS